MSGKRGYAKGIAKREEILERALEIFAVKGYRKASLREVAEAVGLTQAGLLHHFSSKEELFAQVIAKRDEEFVAAMDGREWVDAYDDTVAGMRHNATVPGLVHLYTTMAAEAADPDHPGHEFFVGRYEFFIEHLGGFVAREQEAGRIVPSPDAHTIARLVLAIADGVGVQWLLDSSVDMGAEIENFWSLVRIPSPDPA